ncbi:MAG: hypothetical protein NTY98_09325 [Verrucomicrobia bacterium]|nr:hypothetical protein [Verrucomicrobiota bacterium]
MSSNAIARLFKSPVIRLVVLGLAGVTLSLVVVFISGRFTTEKSPAEAHAEKMTAGDAQLAALKEMKNRCVRDLIAQHQEHRRLAELVFQAHPELRKIPQVLKWLSQMPVEEFPAGAEEWTEVLKKSPGMYDRFFELMVLKYASVWLSLMDDPEYGAFCADVFEMAGVKQRVTRDLTVVDSAAGFRGDASTAAASLKTLRAEYEKRQPVYEAAARAKAKAWDLRVSAEMDKYLMACAQQRVMRDLLKRYYDRFMDGDLAASASIVQALEQKFRSFPGTVKADAGLMAQYRQAAEGVYVGTMSGT